MEDLRPSPVGNGPTHSKLCVFAAPPGGGNDLAIGLVGPPWCQS